MILVTSDGICVDAMMTMTLMEVVTIIVIVRLDLFAMKIVVFMKYQ